MSGNPHDERKLTGTGSYNLEQNFQNIALEDSDNYSDEDFYSDEFETQENEYHEDGPVGEQSSSLGISTQESSTKLNAQVQLYEQYLGNNNNRFGETNSMAADDSHHFDSYQFDESFVNAQQRVQQAYGADTEIYKTLNPKHSQAQILPKEQRHEMMRREIEGQMGSKLFNQLYEMLELEIQNDTDPKARAELVKEICQGNSDLIKLCQKLEDIIYWEQHFTYA
jgi:hypothetical protein